MKPHRAGLPLMVPAVAALFPTAAAGGDDLDPGVTLQLRTTETRRNTEVARRESHFGTKMMIAI